MYLIYSFLYTAALIFLFVPQYLKRPVDLRRRWLREKFGFFGPGMLPPGPGCIWVHAVSVGEVGACIPLLRKLKDLHPDIPVILSTITDTGRRVAMDRAPEGTRVVYLPFDLGFVLKGFISRIRPRIFVVIETEIWPNLFRTLAARDIPVVMLNGRISGKSSRGYRKVSFFMKKVFGNVRVFGMQGQADGQRLREIGADPEKVVVLGNFKFDLAMPREIPSWAAALGGPVIVAGSTFRGEEEIILSAYLQNIDRFPALKLILAPRHPERFREVEDMLRAKNVVFAKRSDLAAGHLRNASSYGVVLLDSVGELASVYGVADIAVIGKSFTGHGGQNPLEPAYWGKAILCGPHMENFPFIADFYREGAAFETGPSELAKKMRELLVTPEKAKVAGEKAKQLFAANAGAVDRAVKIVDEYL
jgi:3-deoxy-D-manno-octulosonic-acid transferase